MRQSNFSMPTWKTLNWTDLHQWHLVNVLSTTLLVQFHLRSSIMHDWSPVWGEFWFMARIIFLDMSIYWQNAHVSEHDAINLTSKGLKFLTSVELHRVKFKGNWVYHLTISIWNIPRLDLRRKLEEEQHPEVLAKKFRLQCPVFLKHPVSVFCVFSVLYSFSKAIVKLLCIWKACTHNLMC
jgi:hypothetical protein